MAGPFVLGFISEQRRLLEAVIQDISWHPLSVRHNGLIRAMRVSTILAVLLAARVAEANPLAQILKAAADNMAKSTDEVTASASKVLGNLGGHSDEAIAKLGRELSGGPKQPLSAADAVVSLRKLGIDDATGDLGKHLVSLDDEARWAVVGILEQSKRVVDAGLRSGMKIGDVLVALKKGGPDALVGIRCMKTPEGIQACLKGLNEYGESFLNFAKGGDEAAVLELARHWDDLKKLRTTDLNDIFLNPTKYFAPNGKPLKSFDDAIAATKPRPTPAGPQRLTFAAAAGAAVAYAFSPDAVVDVVEQFCGETIGKAARAVKWGIWFVLAGLVIAFLWPILAPIFFFLLRVCLKLLARTPGWLGRKVAGWLDRLTHQADARNSYRPRIFSGRRRQQLRIGLLGSRRAGKSTFIVMLTKYLTRLVDGASLQTHSQDPDEQIFQEIVHEVSHCRPTKDDKTLRLDLAWPFQRGGNRLSHGKLDQQLVLTDFPGEWAAPDALPEDHRRLVRHLEDVDGLLVVVDPTELEVEGGSNRVQQQQATIEAMFKADGLALGDRFHRSLGIMITKRDAITTPWLKTLAEQNHRATHTPEFQRLCELAAKRSLTITESMELGEGVLELLFPGMFAALETRLAAIQSSASSSGWLRWMFRQSRPQLAVFAVSQLGFDLGAKVIQHRHEVQAWESRGQQGHRPDITLDLDQVVPEQLDVHLPFQWIFDHIPEGWLHQANTHRAFSPHRIWYRFSAWRRFAGAPVVRRDKWVTLRQVASTVVLLFVVGQLIKPVGDWWQQGQDKQHVIGFFLKAADPSMSEDDLRRGLEECRRLRTKPLVSEVNDFETILGVKETMERCENDFQLPGRPPSSQIQDVLSWLRVYQRLPQADGNWPDGLIEFRRNVASSMPTLVDSLVVLIKAEVGTLLEQSKYDEALGIIQECRAGLQGATAQAVDRAIRDLAGLEPVVKKTQFDAEFKSLKAETEGLVAVNPKDFLHAIRAIEFFRDSKDREDQHRQDCETYREQIVDRFWSHTESMAELAMNGDRWAEVDKLLVDFAQVSEPNKRRQAAEEYSNRLPDKRVDLKRQMAEGLVQDGKPEAAWEQLDGVRVHVGLAKPETRQRWYKTATAAKQQMGKWGEAVAILITPEVEKEPWVTELRHSLWRRWAEELAQEVPQLSDQGKTEDANRRVADFLNSNTSTCPAECHSQVKDLIKIIVPAELRLALRDAEELAATDPTKALNTLLGARTDAEKVEDLELLGRWWRTTKELFVKTNRHSEAVAFLRSLKREIGVPSGTIEEIWTAYAQYIKEAFLSARKEGNNREAWTMLWNKGRDPQAEANFLGMIQTFAQQEANNQVLQIDKSVDQLLAKNDYPGASKMVDNCTSEFGLWLDDQSLGITARLEAIRKRIRDTELDHDVDQFKKQLSEVPPDRLHLGLELALKRSDFTDTQRGKLTNIRDQNLGRWEKDLYKRIREARSGQQFDKLTELLDDYTRGDCPFANKRLTRLDAAKELNRWLKRFDESTQYSIVGICVKGMPDSFWGEYDPAFRVRIKDAKSVQEILAQRDDVVGEMEVSNFSTNTRFTWKKGTAIEIGMWDNYVDNKGHCFGVIDECDAYALLRLGSSECKKLPYKTFDYGKDAKFNNLAVRLRIDGLNEMPDLPAHTE